MGFKHSHVGILLYSMATSCQNVTHHEPFAESSSHSVTDHAFNV